MRRSNLTLNTGLVTESLLRHVPVLEYHFGGDGAAELCTVGAIWLTRDGRLLSLVDLQFLDQRLCFRLVRVLLAQLLVYSLVWHHFFYYFVRLTREGRVVLPYVLRFDNLDLFRLVNCQGIVSCEA